MSSLRVGELGVSRVPDFEEVDVLADHVLKVGGQRPAVYFGAAACGAVALADLKDDAREAVLVDVDFLVVGDLRILLGSSASR